MPNAEPGDLGQTLTRLRKARGFTQKQVADRIPTHYSDAGAYGRIERGERHPDRSVLLAILVQGILIRDPAEIDRVLSLASYEPFGEDEVMHFGLTRAVADTTVLPKVRASLPSGRAVGLLIGSIAVAVFTALLVPNHRFFVFSTSCLYAGLYVISLYLETAYERDEARVNSAAVRSFGLIAVSSVAALAIDHILVDKGSPLALPVSLAIFALAAVTQFLLTRRALPESAVVPLSFQSQTAQGAHVKNTTYFLLFVILCWLPSFHCVLSFAREVREGRADWVTQMLARDLIIGHGVLALSVRALLGLAVIAIPGTWIAGMRLLAQLKPDGGLNSFTLWYYARMLLYYLLCFFSIGWYAYSLSELA